MSILGICLVKITHSDMFLPLSCERLEQDKTATSSTPSSASHTASAVESPPLPQPPAAPTENHRGTGSTAPPTQPVCEEPTPPNNPPAPSYPLHCGKDGWDLLKTTTRCLDRGVSSTHVSPALVSGDSPDHSVTSPAQEQEGDYDVLPIRKSLTFTIDATFPLRCTMAVRSFKNTPECLTSL